MLADGGGVVNADELRARYAEFLDDDGAEDTAGLPVVDVSGGPSQWWLLTTLQNRFGADPQLTAVRLMSGDTLVGTVTRERVEGRSGIYRFYGYAAVRGGVFQAARDPGMHGLPGHSTEAVPLTVRCPVPECQVTQDLLEFDEDNPPVCPADPAHGPSELLSGPDDVDVS